MKWFYQKLLNVFLICNFSPIRFYRYLHELRQRPEIISVDSLAIIFSNVEQILHFQQGFVNALRLAIIQNRIAETFVEYVRSVI